MYLSSSSYKCDNDIHVTTLNNELEQIRKSIILDDYSNGSESFEGNVKENDDSNISAANDTRVLRSKSQKRFTFFYILSDTLSLFISLHALVK